ncbi:MAG: DUF885 family protein [Pirellulales bacterium]
MSDRSTKVSTIALAFALLAIAIAIPLATLSQADERPVAAASRASAAPDSQADATIAQTTGDWADWHSSEDLPSWYHDLGAWYNEDSAPFYPGGLTADGEEQQLSPQQQQQQQRGRGRGQGQTRGRGGRGGRGGGMRGVYRTNVNPTWFANNTKFWYRNNLRSETTEYIVVDAEKGTRGPAFDHAKLARALATAADATDISGERLPFAAIEGRPLLTFHDAATEVSFAYSGGQWTCKLGDTYECTRTGDAPAAVQDANADQAGDQQADPQQRGRGGRGERGGQGRGRGGRGRGGRGGGPVRSEDGKWTAEVREGNIFLRPAGENAGEEVKLTEDGTAEVGYRSLEFAPDGKTLVAFRVEPGDNFEVHLVQSSPPDGGRAILSSRGYPLPGDKFAAYELSLFNLETKKQTKPAVDKIDFGNPNLRWAEDGRNFSYQKVDRGHQRFRIINVDSHTGETKNIIDEQTKTFVWTAHTENLGLGAVNWLRNTDEIVWASEQDGWRHLYLVDAKGGGIKNQITKGDYVLRGIDRIDEEKRQIWFRASGRNSDQDPYLIHYYRINFDGSNLVAMTAGHGNHSINYSPDEKYIVDSYSRVDLPSVTELRRVADGQLVCKLEEADLTELKETGSFRPIEVFVTKGRDEKTDIWGVITRPRDFDPNKKYPVIESIYAGPQGSFVPKSFGNNRYAALADEGYIVVQIDGMGTANRSKTFHDMCWHNIKDGGFPDRIKWMKAAAEKYPYIDVTRVGVYGTSAGGQNAMSAVLFHPEFYDAAVANCGCHDNRMDKSSWNEQWMGYPVGPQYSASSNVDNAYRLQGALFLILGEMDTNVPPESTMRVVDALISANRQFDLLVVPNGGHGAGNAGAYHNRKLRDFFAQHLQGVQTPNRNLDGPGRPPGAPGGRGGRGRGVGAAVQPANENAAAQMAAPFVQQGDEGAKAAQPAADAQSNAAPAAQAPLVLTGLESRATRTSGVADRYRADRNGLTRFYLAADAPNTRKRIRQFYINWIAALTALPTDSFSAREREEVTTLKDEIAGEFARLEEQSRADARLDPLLPFAATIYQLVEERQVVKPMNAESAASRVDTIAGKVNDAKAALKSRLDAVENENPANRLTASDLTRAATRVGDLRQLLQRWHGFYDGYDPMFSWWLRAPFADATKSLDAYATYVKEQSSKLADATAAEASPQPEASPQQAQAPDPAAIASLATGGGPSDVPDLMKIVNAPHGYMELVMQRYQQETGRGGGRGGRGGRGGGRGGRGGGGGGGDRGGDSAANQEGDADAAQQGERGQGERGQGERGQAERGQAERGQADRGQQAAEGNQDNAAAQEEAGRGRRGRRGRGRGQGQGQGQGDQGQGQGQENQQGEAAQGEEGGRGRRGRGEGGAQGRGRGAFTPESREQAIARANRWLDALKQLDFDSFSRADKLDYHLLKTSLDRQVAQQGGEGGRGGRGGGGGGEVMDDSGIPGRPVGREALMADLAREMIDYTPEQLIEIGNREMAWCRAELVKASREMGLGDDWMAAVEKVKNMHAPPGGQPQMIQMLAHEAIDYLRANDLLTVPQIASEIYGMQMMSPQRQLVNPFFTGGGSISVSFPTDTMSHEAKLQSMRGNNEPFARATVHHELIPGHNLQGFMRSRYNNHRSGGGTPFWGEGWALYWELQLYERGFPKTAADRVGFLVWRSHRCARIVFSLSFHMGKMLPGQCVDYLVANVGFDKKNAEGEVRRSFAGGYGPLYQAAYLLGGIQLKKLHTEVVKGGKMKEKEFHDTIIQGGPMPIKMVRILVSDVPGLTRDKVPEWPFYGPVNVPQASATGQEP